MSGGYTKPQPPVIPNAVIKQGKRIRELSKPNTTVTNTATNLAALQTQLNSFIATGTYSQTQIDSKDTAVAASRVAVGSSPTFPDVFVTNAPLVSNNITAARVAAWLQNSNGWLGNTASTERLKMNITEADIDPLMVLSIEPVYYQWIAQVEERERCAALPKDDPEYVPDMHVATEVGFIAERLHEAGLWEFVVYERNDDDSLVLDKNDNPIPAGIHYINWGIALQVVVRYQQKMIIDLVSRVDALEDKVFGVSNSN